MDPGEGRGGFDLVPVARRYSGANIQSPSVEVQSRIQLPALLGHRAKDVQDLRDLMDEIGVYVRIIPKIEKPEALEDIDAIIDLSDGIMVARGDLGVELPPEAVPIAQTQLVGLARSRGKPVIVATQMLESMVENARPTRAEVSVPPPREGPKGLRGDRRRRRRVAEGCGIGVPSGVWVLLRTGKAGGLRTARTPRGVRPPTQSGGEGDRDWRV